MYKKLIGVFVISATLLVGCSDNKEEKEPVVEEVEEVVEVFNPVTPKSAVITKFNIETHEQETFKEFGQNETDEIMLSNLHLILDSKSPAAEPRELYSTMAQYTVINKYPDGKEVIHYLWENNKDGQADVLFEGTHYTLTQQMSNEIFSIIENF